MKRGKRGKCTICEFLKVSKSCPSSFFNSVAFYLLKYKSVSYKNVHIAEHDKIFDNLDLETCVAWQQPGTSRKGKRLQ
jgi:hypothetical protein